MRANLSTVENVSIFDTYKHIKALQKSGFQEEQARVIVESLLASRDSDLSKLVTKEVFLVANNELKEEIASVRSELKEEIASLRSELKEEIGEVKVEIAAIKVEIAAIKEDLNKFATKEEISKFATKEEITAAKNEVMRGIIALLVSIVLTGAGVILTMIFK